jgi:DNA-binding NtrC family response regulator
MSITKVIVVGDNQEQCEKVKMYSQSLGCVVQVFAPSDWSSQASASVSQLPISSLNRASDGLPSEGAKILPFPQPQGADGGKVKTINELESMAIENAIQEFGGNLTEAARALGIGRATLYRKVKQYQIDPSSARKKRAA